MSDTITITGLVATPPRHITTTEGLHITSFRLASTQRRYDRSQERWIDGDTNWYTITTFRQLAINAITSVTKGQRVLVSGRLRIREWANGEKTGTTIEIEADAVGHDLSWGSAVFTRSVTSSSGATAGDEARDDAATDSAADASTTADGAAAGAGDTWATPRSESPTDESRESDAEAPQPALATPF